MALEGIFADARNPMVVKRILDPVPAPMATTPKTQLHEFNSQGDAPMRVVTACGPFTTADNVEYLPLQDLLQIVIGQKPDVLVLVGPFIDTNHASFAEGCVKYDGMMLSFEDIFLFKGNERPSSRVGAGWLTGWT